ncbi:MAG: ABC transporter ATP-binding protein [Hyphomicrobiaceae bacterium]|nr:ABC transporter ATP-binding protein [Hyphomicrobiaceae bacterium]
MTEAPTLAVSALGKSFGGFVAVDEVSFVIRRGEIVALIGPNGAGKTTTFNMINGQLRPDRGRVLLDGEDVTGLGPRGLWQRGVARTFQITATFNSMTVAENVAVALLPLQSSLWHPARMPTLDAPEVQRLVADVGLAGQDKRICGTLAYGDLKRVELAMALANRPRLLLMDEPTAGMAAAEREALMALAVTVARLHGAAIVFTEHDMGLVFRHAHRVIVMSAGRVIADGAPTDVRRSPLVREVYLGRATATAASRRKEE